jgi:hypothetical protein
MIPTRFCWTKYGVEAGQNVTAIFERKEQERQANKGVFLWGIGNAVLPSILELVREVSSPEVLFSPIATRPRTVDVSPKAVVAWRAGVTPAGAIWEIPDSHLCTSGFDCAVPRRPHYALVCSSDESLLTQSADEQVFPSTLKNFVSGNPLGASQVTAVVARDRSSTPSGRSYEVTMRARLVRPFCVQLMDPVFVPPGYVGSSRQSTWQSVAQLQPTLFTE